MPRKSLGNHLMRGMPKKSIGGAKHAVSHENDGSYGQAAMIKQNNSGVKGVKRRNRARGIKY